MSRRRFGTFSGTASGPAFYYRRHRFCLVYLPSTRILATVQSYRECKVLAAELRACGTGAAVRSRRGIPGGHEKP